MNTNFKNDDIHIKNCEYVPSNISCSSMDSNVSGYVTTRRIEKSFIVQAPGCTPVKLYSPKTPKH